MATSADGDADTAVPGAADEIDMSPQARARRAEQGPFEIFKMPDDDNPGLPPEVWPVPPEGFKLPE